MDWHKNGNNYETKYSTNDGDRSVTFDASGMLVESEVQIAVSALPASVMEYMKKNYTSDEMKGAYQITSANGTTTYEAEVIGTGLIFDSNGNFIKPVKE